MRLLRCAADRGYQQGSCHVDSGPGLHQPFPQPAHDIPAAPHLCPASPGGGHLRGGHRYAQATPCPRCHVVLGYEHHTTQGPALSTVGVGLHALYPVTGIVLFHTATAQLAWHQCCSMPIQPTLSVSSRQAQVTGPVAKAFPIYAWLTGPCVCGQLKSTLHNKHDADVQQNQQKLTKITTSDRKKFACLPTLCLRIF